MPADMKQIIARTFMEMVKENGMDKVTVKALVEACRISRQTFYYHFQDIMEVVEWSMNQAIRRMLERTLTMETPREAIGVFVEAVLEHYGMIRKMLNSQHREQLENMFVQALRAYLGKLIETKRPLLELNYSDMELLLDFWACGLTGVLFRMSSQKYPDAKRLADQLCRILTWRIPDLPGLD